MRKKILIAVGLALLGFTAVWQFALAPRWTQRIPPGWSWKTDYIGFQTYVDPQTGQIPEKDVSTTYSQSIKTVPHSQRPGVVELDSDYLINDITSGQVSWEYELSAPVNPQTGEHLKPEYRGDYFVFPQNVEKKTYSLRFSYLKGIPVAFQKEVDVEGLNTYLFAYRGRGEYTESYAGTEKYEGVKVKSGQEIKCADDQYFFKIWVEPLTGATIKIEEGCHSGDYVYDVATGTQLEAVSRWDGVTAGDDVINQVKSAGVDRTRLLWIDRYLPSMFLLAGLLCFVCAWLPVNFPKLKMPQLRSSLAAKWIILQVVGLGIVLCLVGFYQYRTIRETAHRNIKDSGYAVSQAIKEMLAENPELFHSNTLQSGMLRLTGKIANIKGVTLTDSSRRAIVNIDTDTTSVKVPIDTNTLNELFQEGGDRSSTYKTSEGNFLRSSYTIEGSYDATRKSNIVGVLTMDFALSNVEQNVSAAFIRTMQVLAVFLFLFWLLQYVFVRRGFLRWLEHLIVVAERFGKGDFSARAHVTSNDELGQLAGAFNGMAAEVEQSDGALKIEISERKQIEAALREGEQRYRDLFENANDIIYTHDLQGNYTSINKACEKIVGYTSAEALKMNVIQVIAPEYMKEARQRLAEKTRDTTSSYELGIISKDGHKVIVEVNSRLICEDGKPTGVQGMARDITERKRAEAERQVIAEIVQSVITTTNLDELFKLAHQAVKKILPAESCFIALHNLTTDAMHCEYWVDQFDPAPLPRPLGKGFSSYMLRTGQPLLLTKEFKEQMYERGEVQKSGTDSLSWLGVPLRTRSRTIGVLVVQDYHQELAYNQRDLEFLSAVGDQLGLAIERKRIELELKANEIQLIEAQQIANLGSWEWDVQANKVSWSDELYRIYGLQPQEVEVTYEGSLTWVHPDDRKLVKSTNEQTLQDKVHPNLVYRIIRQDGTVRVLQANGRVTDDDTGRIIKMVGTVLDITEQKRADESLRESEERYELAVEGSNDGLWDWNMETNDVYFSPRWKSMIGYEEHEVENIFKSWEAALHPDDRGHAFDTLRAFVDGRTSQYALEHRLQHKDGTYRWILARAAILRDANGKPYRMSGSHTDITERKQLEFELTGARDAALESVRLKSQFLANMSHEIRTPMNGVIGMAGLLLDTELNDDQRDCAETIRSSGEALLTIINDILDFSKIEAGKLKFDLVDFDLRNAVEGAVELLAERARERNIEFASFVHSNVPTALQGDPGRLRQVLTNLTGNALKFTEEGEVVVTAEKEKETDSTVMIRFSIRDTGIGINEATQKKLFQAFTQADGSTTRKYGGTGLGLSISKQLVDLMGGQIGVISTPGQGSTFWFTASFDKQPPKAVESLRRLESLEKVRVLIVDDNATNRKILSHQLSSWGMAHDEAESGLRALELMKVAAAEGRNYDLAILDFLMPGMDGFELAEAIHADPDISRVRMVLLTSAGERGDGVRSRNAGISAYLSKPVRQSQLFDCLIAVMSESVDQGASRMSNSSTLVTKHNLKERKTMSLKLILLAEDNIVNQKVAIRQLQKLGYRCDAVANGREAIEALSRIPYDLVLMDCQMPEMDGYEATGEIRRTEVAPKHTPIVAMTAHALEGDREKCIASGMDDYITKPVQLEELTRVLNAFLDSTKKENREIPIETSPVDLARLHGTIGDEPTQFSETLSLYLENMSENLGQLEAALALGDCNEIESIAHSCAGASAICGMTAVVGPFRGLEIAARESNLAKSSRALAQAKEEFERLRTFLNEQIK